MNDDYDAPECDYGACENDAVAVYEGITPPDGTIRFNSCAKHEPDFEPIERLDTGCSA